jgi:hypothetical protein
MATLNLGRIKPVFRGAYAGGTAYVVDDIVTSGGETFICIQASTGNATSSASHWTKLAEKGTNGTNGTDVGTTLTTQGDILYRDGSGLQRLGAGTSGQVLQTGGTGANPSWGTVSSDFVKIAGVDLSSSNATSYNFAQFIDHSTYRAYKFIIMLKPNTENTQIRMRFLNNTSAYNGSSDYRHAGSHLYRRAGDNGENTQSANSDADGRDYALMHSWGVRSGYWAYFEMTIMGTNSYMGFQNHSWGRDNSGGTSGDYIFYDENAGHLDNTGNVDGVQFYLTSGALHNSVFTLYGVKK